jgi:ketosteroid isomerase-like protein
MSEENVEIVLEAVDAVNKRDPDAFIACLHPDIEWQESGDPFPGLRGTYRGRAELRRWFEEAIVELWETLHVDVEEITDVPEDRVFLGFLITARGRGSGAETELRGWQVLLCTGGKVASRHGPFWTREEALEAAGLGE